MTKSESRGISVIMPARNAARTIHESISSILAQPEVTELIVIDDGSTDNTSEIVKNFQSNRIIVVPGPQSGISAALNAGFLKARYPYVARCDSDDLFVPGRLDQQLNFLTTHDEYAAVSGGFTTIDDQGNALAHLSCDGEARDVTQEIRSGKPVTHLCTFLIRRNHLIDTGGARPWFETAEDVDLQFRLSVTGSIWHIPEVFYKYRLHGASITHTRSSEKLRFFDQAAVDFLKDRLQTGEDDLSRGTPPPIPNFSINSENDKSELKKQIIGHLTTRAWSEFRAGDQKSALRTMATAVFRDPLTIKNWRSLSVMIVKIMRPSG